MLMPSCSTWSGNLPVGPSLPSPLLQPVPWHRSCLIRTRALLKKPVILVVDDVADVRTSIAEILVSEGFAVIEAANGREAVDRARSERPDLVLMDLSLPLLDGASATRVLKTFVPTRSIPVVAFTGLSMSVSDLHALGFAGAVRKPCTPKALVECIGEILGPRRPTD